jgi:hypothetical protein
MPVQKSVLRYLPASLQNRYFVALVAFLFVILVVDKHNLLTQTTLWQTKRRLIAEKAAESRKIETAQSRRQDLDNNKEKFARELYYMHRTDEDVYIIEE